MVAQDPRIPQVQLALAELNTALKTTGEWQPNPPSAEALASRAPFCCDTMTFAQWLQFVLLQRLETMMAQGMTLPANSGILAMGEQTYGDAAHYQPLLDALASLDNALNGENGQ